MGSGGTKCDACRQRKCECLPLRTRNLYPECPWCGEMHPVTDMPTPTKFRCECGKSFETTQQVVYISKPVIEERNDGPIDS